MSRGRADSQGSQEPDDEVVPYSDDETDDELEPSSDADLEEQPEAEHPPVEVKPSGWSTIYELLIYGGKAVLWLSKFTLGQ